MGSLSHALCRRRILRSQPPRPATPLVHFWGAGREREGIAGAQTGRVLLRGAREHAEEIRLKPVDAFLHPHADALPELLVRTALV